MHRARAYIERARSALSERQRKGEELIHTGADAFNRGESETARRLLISAVEQGAGTEEAMALLARLDRLAAAGVRQERRPDTIAPSIQGSVEAANGSTRAWITWTVGGAIAGAAAVAVLLGVYGLPRSSWVPFASSPAIRAAMRANDEPVPVPSASDVWLARAQAKDRGHLRDALSALDAINRVTSAAQKPSGSAPKSRRHFCRPGGRQPSASVLPRRTADADEVPEVPLHQLR